MLKILYKIYKKPQLTLLFFIASLFLNTLGSSLIYFFFPNRPFGDDLFFSLTPAVMWLQYFSDPALILGMISFTWLTLKKMKKKRVFYNALFALSISLWLRAFMMILTPMARHETANQGYGVFQNVVLNGMFPSGHTAASLLIYLYGKDLKTSIFWKHFFLGLFIVQVVSLLLSRGHYSIDIAGGAMIAYVAYRKTDDYVKKLKRGN